MHPNTIKHLQKLDASVTWLARWGVADSASLCRSASLLLDAGRPSVQARHWAQMLVREGFAECIDLEKSCAGARKAFVATRTARMHATALGVGLTEPYRLNEAKLAHRLIAQRAVLDLVAYVRQSYGSLVSYTTESEMPGRSSIEFMERWPDAGLVIHTATNTRHLYIEVERNVRSASRLSSMAAGLAELLRHKAAMNACDGVLVLCPSPASADRYRAAFQPGARYVLHARRGLDYIAAGGTGRMPPGVHVVAGWSVSSDVAEALTGARAAADDVAAEL